MAASVTAASCMLLSTRYLSATLDPSMIAFARSALVAACVTPFIAARHRRRLRFSRPGLHALRGVLLACALNLAFHAVANLPVATVTVLFFLAPVFVTILAATVLGERVGRRRWLAVGAGFVGAAIILRPTGLPEPAMLFAVGASFLFAAALALGRTLARRDGAESTFISTTLVAAVFTLPPALPVWSLPEGVAWYVLAILVLVSALRGYSDLRAFAIGDAAFLAPLAYTRLIILGVAGYLLFDEIPGASEYAGAAVIVASTLYIARREVARMGAPVSGSASP